MHNSDGHVSSLFLISNDPFKKFRNVSYIGSASIEVLIGEIFNNIEEDDFLTYILSNGGDSSPPPTEKQTNKAVCERFHFLFQKVKMVAIKLACRPEGSREG